MRFTHNCTIGPRPLNINMRHLFKSSKYFTPKKSLCSQNLVDTVGRILDPRHRGVWRKVHESEESLAKLFMHMEQYGATLARNMLQLFTQPFDSVHKNLGKY